ncbi:unnamed protein product [Ambrosiozyma monospora]|uniref:Unnamed protein product n=1 Tax=Ambrosiozyma monospora TaxID=43982 RepID=A0ACB5STU5_AMBMO|nr:unnamed protein product [Ambrosiozyma monospora]
MLTNASSAYPSSFSYQQDLTVIGGCNFQERLYSDFCKHKSTLILGPDAKLVTAGLNQLTSSKSQLLIEPSEVNTMAKSPGQVFQHYKLCPRPMARALNLFSQSDEQQFILVDECPRAFKAHKDYIFSVATDIGTQSVFDEDSLEDEQNVVYNSMSYNQALSLMMRTMNSPL